MWKGNYHWRYEYSVVVSFPKCGDSVVCGRGRRKTRGGEGGPKIAEAELLRKVPPTFQRIWNRFQTIWIDQHNYMGEDSWLNDVSVRASPPLRLSTRI